MSKKIINIEDLQREAKNYDGVLRALPFFNLDELRSVMGVNILDQQGEDVLTNRRRVGALIGAYTQGKIDYNDELGKIVEMSLKPELVYAALRDNILNYKDKKVVGQAIASPDNKTKVHPLEQLILEDVVRTVGEDILFSFFFGERDDSVKSPMTAFTGIFPLLDVFITKGAISASEKNLKTTGAFTAPAAENDTDAYQKAVEFLIAADPLLKRGGAMLYYTNDWLRKVKLAYMNLVKHQKVTNADVFDALRDDANFVGLKPVTHEAYGTGDKLMVIKPGLLDLGMDTKSASQYVQVRNIFEDPNEVQYWNQFGVGTRIRDIHRKVLLINEQQNSAAALSGDYIATTTQSQEGAGE